MLVFLINILLVSGVFSESPDSGKNDAGMLAVFWNLENFFDYTDSGAGDSDAEFSGTGSRHWTKSRYWKKCYGIAKTFLWIAEECGRLPDVAGVAEVENRAVVRTVINGTLLRKFDYACVHHDSPDTRGIDVALVYRTGIFRKTGEKAIAVNMDVDGNPMTTRDILYVCLETVDAGVKYHFFVNHHPSKYGGEQVSEGRRMAAMRKMVSFCDSLAAAGERNIICMGDFNDTPLSYTYRRMSQGLQDAFREKGRGFSHTYRGFYNTFRIDYILASGEFEFLSYEVPAVEFSDHHPVFVRLKYKTEP